MPETIHEAAMKKQLNWNVSRPQEVVPEPLPENFAGTLGGGLPVRRIPFLEFPRVVYMHPNEPLREVEHRNDKFELVGTEVLSTEHLTKTVNNESELEAAIAEGWVKEPYITKWPPKLPASMVSKRKPVKRPK